MNLNAKTIDKFISNTFEIDCIEMTLTQKVDDDPIVYSGPGTIKQNGNGILELKLYCKINDIKKEMSHRFKHHTPGKIISDDSYFSLKAIDMSGVEWTSDNIWISANVSFPASGQVIKARLREIETFEEGSKKADKNYLFVVLPGSFEIPCNEKVDLPSGGWRLSRSVFTANDLEVDLNKHEKYLIINVNSKPENLNKDTSTKILEALNIILGKVARPVVLKYTLQENSVLKIKSVPDSFSNKNFPPPFKHSSPSDIQSFSCFLEKYLMTIENPYSDLYGFWHKVNRAWQADIENASLSIGVAIEGILSSYFRELGLPDGEITKQANAAIEALDGIELGERIKERLLGSIGGLLSNSSPKGVLYNLAQSGVFKKSIAKQWVKLRNKSVHPDKLNEDPRAFQKYIDLIYSCISLFYILLFLIIKYDGKYLNYSENGWPEKTFKDT